MPNVYYDSSVWIATGADFAPGDVHHWYSTWAPISFNNQGGNVARYPQAIPLTNFTMRLSTEILFVEGNPNGWNLLFDVKNVGARPIRQYVVRIVTITGN